jgi:hypothetical protein
VQAASLTKSPLLLRTGRLRRRTSHLAPVFDAGKPLDPILIGDHLHLLPGEDVEPFAHRARDDDLLGRPQGLVEHRCSPGYTWRLMIGPCSPYSAGRRQPADQPICAIIHELATAGTATPTVRKHGHNQIFILPNGQGRLYPGVRPTDAESRRVGPWEPPKAHPRLYALHGWSGPDLSERLRSQESGIPHGAAKCQQIINIRNEPASGHVVAIVPVGHALRRIREIMKIDKIVPGVS